MRLGTAALGLADPIAIALDRGYFEASGVTVELQSFRDGADLVAAVMANQVQIGVGDSIDVPVFRADGIPIRYVATTVDGNPYAVHVLPAIAKLADLKGRSIGVSRVGATSWALAVTLARRQGWDPDKDVRILGLGGIDAQLTALARGEIQAFVSAEPVGLVEPQGQSPGARSRILMRLDRLTPRWISESAYATDHYIRGHRAAIVGALKAFFQGARLIREAPAEADAIAARWLGLTVDTVARARRLTEPRLSKDGTINVEAIDVMQGAMVELRAQKRKVPTTDLYTVEFTPVRV